MICLVLKKDKWLNSDIIFFEGYLVSLSNSARVEWICNNTKTNMCVLGIRSGVLRGISNEICKGDWRSFLDFNLNNYYEEIIINAYIINKINDHDLKCKYLNFYIKNDLCWSTCDVLKFDNDKRYLGLAKSYLKSSNNFIVRIGIIVFFSFIRSDLNSVFNLLSFINSNDYYVNMAYAWILCEIYIVDRNSLIKFIRDNNINSFVIDKMVSKCCDSYRLSVSDKEKIKKSKKRV